MTTPLNFNADTPTVDLDFDLWQRDFQANFQRMSDAFKVNHLPLEATGKLGNHTIIQMPERPAEEKIQTNIGDFALFTRLVEDQTDQVFIQYEGNLAEFQYTNYQIYPIKDIVDNKKVFQKTYFTTLPGKIIVIFGSKLDTKSKVPSVRLIPPVCKNIISVNITLIGTFPVVPARAYEVTPISSDVDGQPYFTSIDVNFSLGAFNPFYYLVMGNL